MKSILKTGAAALAVVAAAFAVSLAVNMGASPDAALALLIPAYPGLNEFWQKIASKFGGGGAQATWQPLYDTAIYAPAGQTQLTFFQSAAGAAGSLSAQPGAAGQAKSYADTNLTGQGGQMNAGQAFFVHSIEVRFLAGSTAAGNTFAMLPPSAFNATASAAVSIGEDDVAAFYGAGNLALTIGQGVSPQYQDGPLVCFPPRSSLGLDVAVASNAAATSELVFGVAKAQGGPCVLNPGLGIEPAGTFGVTLGWPVAAPLPSGFNGQVQVKLNGWKFLGVAQ